MRNSLSLEKCSNEAVLSEVGSQAPKFFMVLDVLIQAENGAVLRTTVDSAKYLTQKFAF